MSVGERSVDHYERLGVGPDASTAEIRAAYRRLANEMHPDHGRGTGVDMASLNEAYSTLRDPARRVAYDRARRGQDRTRDPRVPPAPRGDRGGAPFAGDQRAARRFRLLVVTAVATGAFALIVLVLVALAEGY